MCCLFSTSPEPAGVGLVSYASRYSESTASEPSLLYAPFPFLREFGTPLAVQECHSRDDALMVNADVPVILCDPLTTHPKSIQNDPILRTNPNAIVVFTSSFSSTTPPQTPNGPTLLFADPRRANSALQTLHANPTSPVAVQRYQDEYISSQISDIFAAIRAALNPSTGTPIHIHLALSHVQAALNACALSVQKAKDDLAALSTSISVVAGQVQESRARMANEVFSTSFQDDVVKVALEKAEAEVKASMDRLTAWRTIWRVDDISSIISGAVDGAWCKDLESHVGPLSMSLVCVVYSYTIAHLSSRSAISPPERTREDYLGLVITMSRDTT